MVRFEDDKLVIEVSGPFPAEKWMDIQRGICDILRNVKQDTIIDTSFYSVVDFLIEMMPDYDVAKKMCDSQPKKLKQ